MEKSVTMPKLGMTMTEGTVLQWLYKEGDFVEKDEALLEVMTDKVNMEVEAPFSGYLTSVLAQEGDVLPVGAPLAVLTDEKDAPISKSQADSVPSQGRKAEDESKQAEKPKNTASPTIERELVAAHISSSSVDGVVASTPAARREAAIHGVDLRAVVQAGTLEPLDRADVLAFVQRQQASSTVIAPTPSSVRATPVAQKFAREHQVDLAAIVPQRADGKVTRADVEAHLSNGHTPEKPEAVYTTPAPLAGEAESELLPLSPVRALIGQRMLTSISTMPHIYLDTEIDMTEAERCRQRVGESLQKQGEKTPSLTAVLLRALAAALQEHPQVNSALVSKGLNGKDAIRQWKVVHLGVAVDTGQSLVTPVIRNAHRLSLAAISRELRRVTQAAHQGTIKPEDMAGATFTVSNLGMYGIDTFHAIIAPGQSAILAVGGVTKRGVVVEDAQGERLVIRPMMKISLSADHRVLDGATGSRFLQSLKQYLEEPYLLV